MADDQISVDLIAKIDGLISGLKEAKDQIAGTTQGIASDVHDMAESVKHEEGLLHEVLSGALFLEFAEIARESLEGVKEAFESTVVKAEEFGLSNAKFAAMMGTSETEAAGLSAALRGVGSSSQEYEGMALRLEMRLQTQEESMRALGMTTRDASGNLLSGKELMDSAIATMGEYKSGTDQNAFALQVFGRRAADVYNLMRVGDEQVSRQIEIYKQFGVNLEGTGASSAELEDKLNDMRTMFDAIGISLGQQLMPVFTSFIGWMSTDGQPIIQGFVVVLKGLVTVAYAIEQAFIGMGGVVSGVVTELYDVLKGLGKVIGDALSGNWGALGGDVKASWSEMKDDAKATFDAMSESGQGFIDTMDRLWGSGGAASPEKNPFKPEGGGTKSFHAPSKGGADKGQEEAIAAEEKFALEQIAIESKTNASLLAMGKETADAYVAQQVALENAAYAIKLDALQKELTVSGKTKVERQKTLDEMAQLELEHAGKIRAIDEEAQAQQQKIHQQGLADYIRDSNERLSVGMAAIQRDAAATQFSAESKFNAEIALTAQIKGEQLKRLDEELATLNEGTAEWQRVYKEREKVVKEWAHAVDADQKTLWADTKRDVESVTKSISGSFNQSLNAMILNGESFDSAMKSLWKSLLGSFLSMIEQMLEQWIVNQITKQMVAETTQRAQAVAQIPPLAAVAAAGAASSQASIPYVGPALAAAAAGETFAMVMGYEGVAAAAGGMLLDKDQLVFAHKNEQILPAHLSAGLQSIIANGRTGGGDVNLHYQPTVNAGQNQSLAKMLESQSRDMLDWINARYRDGSLGRYAGR